MTNSVTGGHRHMVLVLNTVEDSITKSVLGMTESCHLPTEKDFASGEKVKLTYSKQEYKIMESV